VQHRIVELCHAFTLALALTFGAESSAMGQRVRVEGGVGAGVSTTADHHQVRHAYVVADRALTGIVTIGIDASVTWNKDSLCEIGCALSFPNFGSLAIPVSLRLSRFSAGLGPGIFDLGQWTSHMAGHLFVGGLAGHADVELIRLGPTAVVASVRPMWVLGGARSDEDRIAVVPITVGLRW
jgi:hypothetical protein